MNPYMDLARRWGGNVAARREDLGLSQHQLVARLPAVAAGLGLPSEAAVCSQQALSKIEAGVCKPNDLLRVSLAAALGCSVESLFSLDLLAVTA